MRYSILIIVSIFLFSCNNDGPKEVAAPADLEGMTVVEIPGSTLQKAYRYDPNKNVMEEGELLNGKKTGTWVSYHPGANSIVNKIFNYVDGMKNGLYMEIDNRNQVKETGYYTNDQKDRTWTKWNYSRRNSEENFKNGKRHGMFTTFYNTGKDGQKKEEIEFKEGVQDGIYKYYLKDGTISIDYEYTNGEVTKRNSGG